MLSNLFSNNTFELSITPDYISDWGLQEALRELMQNALDNQNDPEVSYNRATQTLTICNNNTTLERSTLPLGNTDKPKNPNARGQYGEGYKLALLVLLRLGHAPVMINGKFIWTPVFKHSKVFNADVLAIEETANTQDSGTSLTFMLHNITEKDYEELVSRCLFLQGHHAHLHEVEEGFILSSNIGRLFAGGLYVCDTRMDYGYDIHPEHIELDRDRSSVSHWSLAIITTRMWAQVEDSEAVVQLLKHSSNDVAYADRGLPQRVQNACYQDFVQEYGECQIVADQKEYEIAIKAGTPKAVIVSDAGYRKALLESPLSTKQRIITILEETPSDILTKFYNQFRKVMPKTLKTEFNRLRQKSTKWKVK